MRRSRVLLPGCTLLTCFVLLGSNCDPRPSSSRAIITAYDAFMLTYIDSNERLRLRWSNDGYRWQDGTLNAAGVFDNGVSSASTDDAGGTVRMLAYPSVSGRLTVRAGLGVLFDGTDRTFNDVPANGPPAIAYASTNHWLITTLGGSLNQSAVVHDYNASTHALTAVGPAGVPGLQNDRMLRPPQIAARNGRVVVGWMRWNFVGQNRLPGPMQLVVGNAQSSGAMQWTNVVNFTTAEPGFGSPLGDPALTHDGARFLLGVVRRNASEQRVFIYQSPDGLAWQPFDSAPVATSGDVFTVRVAGHDGGNMLVGVTRAGGADFSRKFRGEWEPVRGANVFGTRRESSYAMSLLAPGKRRAPIFVDRNNTTAPWNGTETDPYRTLQDAFNRAKRGDTVIARTDSYIENVTMPPGTILEPRGPTVLVVRSPGNEPTIRAQGDNVIENTIVECNVTCIEVQVDQALAGLEGNGSAAYVNIVKSRPRGGEIGVLLVGSDTLDFGANNLRLFNARLLRSWISNHIGAGLLGDVNGPANGSLHVSLDVRDNVFQDNFSGIQLQIEGRSANIGGFVRAQYSGRVHNNLIFGGRNGATLDARNAGAIFTAFTFNTLARNIDHGIVAEAAGGANGAGRVSLQLFCNIFADNAQFGYMESTAQTAPRQLDRNFFFGNGGHYLDFPTDSVLNTQDALNSATTGGNGNLVADPLFVRGGFEWTPNTIDFGETGHFFLQQDGTTTSPAVNRCGPASLDLNQLRNHTTRIDQVQDAAPPDAGWHYPRNR